jgi:hypothetical protein
LKHKPDDRDALKTLVPLLTDANEQVKLTALQAVADAKSTCEGLVPALRKLWKDPNTEIRNQVSQCLAVNGHLGRIMADQLAAVSHINVESTMQAGVSETSRPSMPSDDFIKEWLVHQFGENVVFQSARRLPQPAFLRRHIFIEVLGNAFGEIHRGMWSSPASGLYAYDGNQLIYLNGLEGTGNIGEILWSEGVQLDQVDPVALAGFFYGTLLQGSIRHDHRLIEPAAGVDTELVISKPSVRVTEGGGWIVSFWTLLEWGACLGVHRSLHEHTISVSRQFKITYEHTQPLEAFVNH